MLMSAHDIGFGLDELSDWELPPSSADDMGPVRAFDSAEAALRFLGVQDGTRSPGVITVFMPFRRSRKRRQ